MGTVFVNAGVVYRKKECWKNDWDRSKKWKNDFWEQNKNFHKLKTKRNWSFKSDERRKWRKNTERSHLYPQHKTFITSYLIFYQACIETISLLHGNPSNCGMKVRNFIEKQITRNFLDGAGSFGVPSRSFGVPSRSFGVPSRLPYIICMCSVYLALAG